MKINTKQLWMIVEKNTKKVLFPTYSFNNKSGAWAYLSADILPHLKKWGSRLAFARHSLCPDCFFEFNQKFKLILVIVLTCYTFKVLLY